MKKSTTITININKLVENVIVSGQLTDIEKANLKKEIEETLKDAVQKAESSLNEDQENL